MATTWILRSLDRKKVTEMNNLELLQALGELDSNENFTRKEKDFLQALITIKSPSEFIKILPKLGEKDLFEAIEKLKEKISKLSLQQVNKSDILSKIQNLESVHINTETGYI